MNEHHHDCGCWMCEADRTDRGEESIHAKHDREANERARQELITSGYECTCTDPYAAFHAAACPWWKNATAAKRGCKNEMG